MIKEAIKQAIIEHKEIIQLINTESVYKSTELLVSTINSGNTVFWCGNGGSASQANHLSAELTGGMYKSKKSPFKSLCLNVDTSFITAWSNDDSYDNIFVRQLDSLSERNDLIVLLSTSGNSKNLINAAKFAQEKGLKVLSLTGSDGGVLKDYSDININIDSNSTQRIQEMHILIGHIICDILENSF